MEKKKKTANVFQRPAKKKIREKVLTFITGSSLRGQLKGRFRNSQPAGAVDREMRRRKIMLTVGMVCRLQVVPLVGPTHTQYFS